MLCSAVHSNVSTRQSAIASMLHMPQLTLALLLFLRNLRSHLLLPLLALLLLLVQALRVHGHQLLLLLVLCLVPVMQLDKYQR